MGYSNGNAFAYYLDRLASPNDAESITAKMIDLVEDIERLAPIAQWVAAQGDKLPQVVCYLPGVVAALRVCLEEMHLWGIGDGAPEKSEKPRRLVRRGGVMLPAELQSGENDGEYYVNPGDGWEPMFPVISANDCGEALWLDASYEGTLPAAVVDAVR
jgi:hypothetical protein